METSRRVTRDDHSILRTRSLRDDYRESLLEHARYETVPVTIVSYSITLDDLESALKQFQLIANDLGGETAESNT